MTDTENALLTLLQLGGAFTNHATRRWCFDINLPLGGITAVGLLTLLKLPPKEKTQKAPMDIFLELDPIGTVIFVPVIVCLLLALQWGGVTYDWSNGCIIALFVISVPLLLRLSLFRSSSAIEQRC